MAGLTGTHLIVIVFIVLLLFGAPKLPALAKSLGQSMKILKKEVGGGSEDTDASKAESTAAVAPGAPTTPDRSADPELR